MTEGAEARVENAAQYAYRLLALRPLSEKEFRAKLRNKGFSSPVVEDVFTRFKELGYLNDESFARQRARALAVNRLWGNYRIEQSLKEKGISPELIQDALALAREEMTERAAVLKLIGKKGKAAKIHSSDKKKGDLSRA